MKANAKQIMDDWDKLATKLSDFGAADTEPGVHFETCIGNALQGSPVKIPQTAREWELFTDTAGVETATAELVAFTQKAVDQILQTPISDLAELRKAFKGRFWYMTVE